MGKNAHKNCLCILSSFFSTLLLLIFKLHNILKSQIISSHNYPQLTWSDRFYFQRILNKSISIDE